MLILATFVGILIYGIKIDQLNISKIKIDKLYIKLDKKLIVNAKKIDINFKESKKSSTKELYNVLRKIPWLDYFFKQINIENMNINGNTIKLLYKDDIFYLDTTYFKVDANIKNHKKQDLIVELKSFALKDFDLNLSGILRGNLKDKEAVFKGDFNSFNIKGEMVFYLKKKMLEYSVKTYDFNSLKPFLNSLNTHVNLSKELLVWLRDKINAKSFQIKELQGKINIENGDFFPFDMRAKAILKEARVKYHKILSEVLIKQANLELKNNKLFLDFIDPSYENINLNGTHGYIYNLLTKGNGIVLNLFANTKLDDKILNILKAYRLKVPLFQRSGEVQTKLKLDIHFVPYDIDVKGDFFIQNSNINIANQPFFTKKAVVKLDNSIIKLQNTNLSFKDIFELNTSGEINLKKDNYEGDAFIKFLNIKKQDTNFLALKGYKTPVIMEFKKDNLHIDLLNLKTKLFFLKHTNNIYLDDISLFYDSSNFLQNRQITKGKVLVETKDFENFDIFADILKIKPILRVNNKALDSFKANIDIGTNKTHIKTQRDFLEILFSNNTNLVKIKNADLLLNSSSKNSKTLMNIKADNSNIFFQDLNKTLLFHAYDINISKNFIKANAIHKRGKALYYQNDNFLSITADNFNDKFVNTYLHDNLFKEGSFGLKLKGKNFDDFVAYVNFQNTFIKSFSFYNKLLAFINSVPNLLTFKKQGFNEKGYSVKKANILFSKKGSKLYIKSIDIQGVNADILGTGVYDLSTHEINLKLKLKTFKSISDIVSKIPMINYIILGNDNSIQTHIKVSGNIDSPNIQTQTAKDISLVPFNVLKRTISLPFKIFD